MQAIDPIELLMTPTTPAIVVFVCGVCGSGKTTVGKALAAELDASFIDADDLHPPGNVAKLRAGAPLDDADRAPWLAATASAAAAAASTTNDAAPAGTVVVACSALKRAYRELLRRRVEEQSAARAAFVLLAPGERALRERLASAPPRPASHVAPDPLRLLPSQLATLERHVAGEQGEEWAVVVEGEDALAPPDEQARAVARRIFFCKQTTSVRASVS